MCWKTWGCISFSRFPILYILLAKWVVSLLIITFSWNLQGTVRFLITIFRSPVWYGFISLKITGGVKRFEVPLTFFFSWYPRWFPGHPQWIPEVCSLTFYALNCCTPTLRITGSDVKAQLQCSWSLFQPIVENFLLSSQMFLNMATSMALQQMQFFLGL